MLCVNAGGEAHETWIRAEDRRDPFYKGTRGLQPIFTRCLERIRQRAPLDDRTAVLAPRGDGTFARATISDSTEAERALGKKCSGTRFVQLVDSWEALSVAESRLVRAHSYFRKVVGVDHIDGSKLQHCAGFGGDGRVVVWRSEIWTDGLFSMLFWALGFLQCYAKGVGFECSGGIPSRLLVDWTDECILFQPTRRKGAPSNAWNSFFEPPPLEPLEAARRAKAAEARRAAAEMAAKLRQSQRSLQQMVAQRWPEVAAAHGYVGTEEGSDASSPAEGQSAPLSAGALDEAAAERRVQSADDSPAEEQSAPAGVPPPLSATALEEAMAEGRVQLVAGYGLPYFPKLNGLMGADRQTQSEAMQAGRLNEAAAAAGRAAVSRWVRVRAPLLARVHKLMADEMGVDSATQCRDWLAVHVRMTDKLLQCPYNEISVHEIVNQTIAFCGGCGCGGVLVCSDEKSVKEEVVTQLAAAGLKVAKLDTPLSHSGKPAHMDNEIDPRANAEDALVETLAMSRCAALLSTWSHVSAAVVYFSSEGFLHYYFGDEPPPPKPGTLAWQRQQHAAAAHEASSQMHEDRRRDKVQMTEAAAKAAAKAAAQAAEDQLASRTTAAHVTNEAATDARAHHEKEKMLVLDPFSAEPMYTCTTSEVMSPPIDWPNCFNSPRLKTLLKRIKGRRCRLTEPPSEELRCTASGVHLTPGDSTGNAMSVQATLGWDILKGFVLLEMSCGKYVVQRRWWNVEPSSSSWVDFTPRLSRFAQMVLVESGLPDDEETRTID